MNTKVWVGIAVLLLISFSNIVTGATFQGLGDLIGGDFHSRAYSVSSSGLVVAGQSESASGIEASFWTYENGIKGLGYLSNGTRSIAYGVSNIDENGLIIIGSNEYTTASEAFRWTPTNGMEGLGYLSGGNFSYAQSISVDGSVIVGYSSSSTGWQAIRWTDSDGMVGLGNLPDASLGSLARDVSFDGLVIVGYASSSLSTEWSPAGGAGSEAFRWTSTGGMEGLGILEGGDRSFAHGVSGDGLVVVGTSDSLSGFQGFRWTNTEGMEGLSFLSGDTGSQAYKANEDGSIIVRYSYIGQTEHAYIWDQTNGIQNLQQLLTDDYGLNLDGWTLQRATDISSDGLTIVGYGINPLGDQEGFIAVLPEPATVSLMAVGLIGLLRSRSRK